MKYFYVGNLPNNVGEEDLIELFESVDPIRKVKIGFDSSSGQKKPMLLLHFMMRLIRR